MIVVIQVFRCGGQKIQYNEPKGFALKHTQVLIFTNWINLSKSVSCCEPQFFHQEEADNDIYVSDIFVFK